MKIALVTNFLYPESLGGTEIYCYQLANAFIQRGNEVYWFVPNFSKNSTDTEERGEGIKVVRFAALDNNLQSTLSFTISSFLEEINSRDIKIVHFHEFGGYEGISWQLLEGTKKANIKTVVTLHLANYVCQTGALHYGGVIPCNGKIIPDRCSSCYLFSNKTSSGTLNLALTNISNKLLGLSFIRNIPRINRYMSGVNLKETFISSVRVNADIVITLTSWFKNVLLINGVAEDKIIYVQQVSPEFNNTIHSRKEERKNYVFIGRINKEKGVDLLLKLSSRLKKQMPGVSIDMYGPYLPAKILPHTIIDDLNDYDNVRYLGILPKEDVLTVMSKYKAAILPSRVSEMAPLIIMEANNLRIPIIASDVPGSRELVEQHKCGLVFKYGSADDLFEKIKEIEAGVNDFEFIQPVKNNFYHTAEKHEKIYANCLGEMHATGE